MQTQRLPVVIAHRGYRPTPAVPENSIASFTAAIDAGAPIVETDIHRTRDGVLVLHHDPLLADGRRIADLDYAALPRLSDGTPIPRFAEGAAIVRARGVRLAAELKETGYERQVVDEALRALPLGQLELISFEPKAIKAIETYRPEVRTGLLQPRIYDWMRESFLWPLFAKLLSPLDLPLRAAAKVGADYISMDWRGATSHLLESARRTGVDIDVWTVDRPDLIKKFLHDDRIRGVVTDRTALALSLRPPGALAGQRLLELALRSA